MISATDAPQTYQLHIRLARARTIVVGARGARAFPAGDYIYTGSAKRNLTARVARHFRADKALRWHVDYLLADPAVRIVDARFLRVAECVANAGVAGSVPVAGFGAGDCRAGCGSHLKYIGGPGSRQEAAALSTRR